MLSRVTPKVPPWISIREAFASIPVGMHKSGLVTTDTNNSLEILMERESSYCFVQHLPWQHVVSLSSELTEGWRGQQKPWDETGLQDLRGGMGQRVWHR